MFITLVNTHQPDKGYNRVLIGSGSKLQLKDQYLQNTCIKALIKVCANVFTTDQKLSITRDTDQRNFE